MKVFPFKIWHLMYLGGWPFILLAAVLYVRHTMHLEEGQASRDWAETRGTITKSETRRFKTRRNVRHDSHSSGEGAGIALDLSYTYTVKGKQYESTRVRFGSFKPDPDDMVKRYPKGRAVTVYYDPKDPKKSVLERGAGSGTSIVVVIFAAVVVLWILFPLVYVPSAVRRGRRRVRQHDRINQALRALGFRFRPGDKPALGSEVDAVSEDTPFSLLLPRPDTKDPTGIAVLERDGRLVELCNEGVPEFGYPEQSPVVEEGCLVHVTLETRWMLPAAWETTGREDDPRPLTQSESDRVRAESLFFLALGARHFRPVTDHQGETWRKDPEPDILMAWADYDLEIDWEDERYELQPFDTRISAFDEFFQRRQGAQRVRELLTRPDSARKVMHPLEPWKTRLFDLHVGQTVDAWIHMIEPADWDGLLKDLPKLLDALIDFTERMERALLADE